MSKKRRFAVWELDSHACNSLMKLTETWEEALEAKRVLELERDAYVAPSDDDDDSGDDDEDFAYSIHITDSKGFELSKKTGKRKKSKRQPGRIRRRFEANMREAARCVPACDEIEGAGHSLGFFVENCLFPNSSYGKKLEQSLKEAFDGDLAPLKRIYSGGAYDGWD
jgi:hypothetical protein